MLDLLRKLLKLSQDQLYILKDLATYHHNDMKVCCSGETGRPLHIPSSL